jgi:hypothetical protein
MLRLWSPPHKGESFLGACLRKLPSPGGLHLLRRELGAAGVRMPGFEDVRRIAALLDLDPTWCETHFAGPDRRSPMRWYFGSGNVVLRAHLALPRAQLCPDCLRERGYCRREWDLAITTACPTHRKWLVDACGACRAPVRWDRASLLVCRCKRPLAATSTPAHPDPIELAQVVAARLAGAPCCATYRGLPNFIEQLTIGGLLAVIHAFGDLPDPLARCLSSVTVKAMPATYWREVGARAAARLRACAAGKDVSALINPAILVGYMRLTPAPIDVAICAQLVTAARRERSQAAQFSLF